MSPVSLTKVPGPKPGDFSADKRVVLLSLMSVIVALLAVGAAWLLLHLIGFVTALCFHGELSWGLPEIGPGPLPLWTAALPVAGGIVIGLMARYGSEKIRGHGIPEAMEAILVGQSRLSPKVAVLKPLSSAVSIGTGGPFGAEGPIIMTGGALGSLFAQMFMLSGAERKTLLVAGAAAGMTAVFSTPLAAVLLAVELLLFEWKPRSFIPVAIASGVAAAARGALLPAAPIFPYAAHMVPAAPQAFVGALVIGVLIGVASLIATALVYGTEDVFHRVPLHWMWWPAIGGVVVGLGGLLDARVLGAGYANIRDLLDGNMLLQAALILLVVKTIVWAVALGSGTSGGVLAPLLIIGGALGAVASPILPAAPSGFWAMLGMAAMMGATMRAPLTATLFAAEATGTLDALPALLIACAVSYGIGVLMMKRSILTEKIARRGGHTVSEFTVDPFDLARVSDAMTRQVDTLPATMTIAEVVAFYAAGGRHRTYPVLDEAGALAGVISRSDVLNLQRDPGAAESKGAKTLGELVDEQELITAFPNDIAGRVVDLMIREGIGRMPVIDPQTRALVGLVSRTDFLHVRARAGRSDSERVRYLRLRRARRTAAAPTPEA